MVLNIDPFLFFIIKQLIKASECRNAYRSNTEVFQVFKAAGEGVTENN